jgi:hypothetical protein
LGLLSRAYRFFPAKIVLVNALSYPVEPPLSQFETFTLRIDITIGNFIPGFAEALISG